MAIYKLTFGHQTMLIDSETLDPGELTKLKGLNQCAHFTLERQGVQKLPDLDHDPLDDVAREIVGSAAPRYGGQPGEIYQMARRRVDRLESERMS